MSAQIASLIDKQDNSEIVRDQIALILNTEQTAQQALAVIAGKDPLLWKLRIFLERSNPWEQFRDEQTGVTIDKSPIVNVWYGDSNFDGEASDTINQQKATGTFNMDVYGYAVSADDGATGHLPGDRESALESQRGARLVRNILMASSYVYLGLQGVVSKRWPQAITAFQPEFDGRPLPHVWGVRLAFKVDFNEYSPQYVGETLELVSIDVSEDGEVILEADYPSTP